MHPKEAWRTRLFAILRRTREIDIQERLTKILRIDRLQIAIRVRQAHGPRLDRQTKFVPLLELARPTFSRYRVVFRVIVVGVVIVANAGHARVIRQQDVNVNIFHVAAVLFELAEVKTGDALNVAEKESYDDPAYQPAQKRHRAGII